MLRVVLVWGTSPLMISAQANAPERVNQTTSGQCSPAVIAGKDVVITCSGLDENQRAILEKLPSLIEQILRQQIEPEALISRLDEIIRKQESILDAITGLARYLPSSRGLEIPASVRTLTTLGDRVMPLIVAKSQGLAFSDLQIDRILATASIVLRPCNVRVERVGQVQTAMVDMIDSAYAWNLSKREIPNIQIVKGISWCGGKLSPPALSIGCSEGSTQIFLSGRIHSESGLGLVLAHEIGHLAGLYHRPAGLAKTSTSLMDSLIQFPTAKLKTFPQVTASECDAISALAARLSAQLSQN